MDSQNSCTMHAMTPVNIGSTAKDQGTSCSAEGLSKLTTPQLRPRSVSASIYDLAVTGLTSKRYCWHEETSASDDDAQEAKLTRK
jgi:hypothetical protein